MITALGYRQMHTKTLFLIRETSYKIAIVWLNIFYIIDEK